MSYFTNSVEFELLSIEQPVDEFLITPEVEQ